MPNNKLFIYDESARKVIPSTEAVERLISFSEFFSATRKKNGRAEAELLYIYLVNDPRSPFSDLDEGTRKETSLMESGLDKFSRWKPDAVFEKVVDKYIEYNVTTTELLLRDVKESVHKVREYFRGVSFENDENGLSMKNYLTSMEKLGKLLDSLKGLEERVLRESQSDTEILGDGERGLFD